MVQGLEIYQQTLLCLLEQWFGATLATQLSRLSHLVLVAVAQ
jgi:hypothetical protein